MTEWKNSLSSKMQSLKLDGYNATWTRLKKASKEGGQLNLDAPRFCCVGDIKNGMYGKA